MCRFHDPVAACSREPLGLGEGLLAFDRELVLSHAAKGKHPPQTGKRPRLPPGPARTPLLRCGLLLLLNRDVEGGISTPDQEERPLFRLAEALLELLHILHRLLVGLQDHVASADPRLLRRASRLNAAYHDALLVLEAKLLSDLGCQVLDP